MRVSTSYCHRGGEPPLNGATIPEHFNQVVQDFPGHEALVCIPQQRRLTYAELKSAVDRVARGLVGIGFAKGDRIAVWSTNNVEWLLLQMATARIGAILVNINPAYRTRELAYALQRSEVEGLFIIPAFRKSDYVARVLKLLPSLREGMNDDVLHPDFPYLKRVVIYDPADPDKTKRPAPGFTTWQELLVAGEGVALSKLEEITASLDRDDPINIQYTSGTTGFPKAVLLSHHNILNNALFSARAMHFTEQERLSVPVPFYHCFGMVLANLLCLSVGACIVIPCEYFDAQAVLQGIAQERCTAIHGVPTMFSAVLEQPDFGRFDLSTLRTGIMAGAPCPASLMERVMKEMQCVEILIGYGMTEASPLTHLTSRDDDLWRRTRTVGTNLPHQEVKVVSPEDGHTLPVGEIGEICFRGYHVMRGYYGDAEATSGAVDGWGWLHSGDLGRMDEVGYMQITGRLKEMIIRGGENIYPQEIEEVIITHSKVVEVAVFGVPDKFYGEEVVAWVRLHAGKKMNEAELRGFLRERISHFKIPRYIRFVEAFPMTVTGKLQKFRMRELMVELLVHPLDGGS